MSKPSLAPSTQTDTPGCQQTVSSCLPDTWRPLSSVHCLQKNRAQSKAEKTASLPWAGPSSPLASVGCTVSCVLEWDMAVNQATGAHQVVPASHHLEGDEPRFLGES